MTEALNHVKNYFYKMFTFQCKWLMIRRKFFEGCSWSSSVVRCGQRNDYFSRFGFRAVDGICEPSYIECCWRFWRVLAISPIRSLGWVFQFHAGEGSGGGMTSVDIPLKKISERFCPQRKDGDKPRTFRGATMDSHPRSFFARGSIQDRGRKKTKRNQEMGGEIFCRERKEGTHRAQGREAVSTGSLGLHLNI